MGPGVASTRGIGFPSGVTHSSATARLALIALASLLLGCASAESGDADGQRGASFGMDVSSQDGSSPAVDGANRPGDDDLGATPSADGGQAPYEDGTCPTGTHLGDNGLCNPDVCQKDSATCSDPETVKVCNDVGSAFEEIPCPSGQVCHLGACWAPICDAGEQAPVCDGSNVLKLSLIHI